MYNYSLDGGTALALRLGHRTSVDFDFFSSEPLDFEVLFAFPVVRDADVLQRDAATLTISTPRVQWAAPVKVSFVRIDAAQDVQVKPNRPIRVVGGGLVWSMCYRSPGNRTGRPEWSLRT